MSRAAGDRGAVTAELAVLLPAVVAVLVVVVTTAGAAIAHVRCVDAARAGARAAAIGEPPAQVRATVAQLAGPGASVDVREDGAWVVVVVAKPVPGRVAGLVARAEARAWVEPGGPG